MSIVENLISFFKQPASETAGKAPEGVCPTCWGIQEYDGEVRELYKDKQIDVNNHEANHNFIKEIVVARIDGIKLVKGTSGFVCPNCKRTVSRF